MQSSLDLFYRIATKALDLKELKDFQVLGDKLEPPKPVKTEEVKPEHDSTRVIPKKDTELITMTHLHKLAKHFGFLQNNPDFLRQYTNEKALCAFLADHSSTLTLEDAAAQVLKQTQQ